MKNLCIVILSGIVVFLSITILYHNRKELLEYIEGLGNISTAGARDRAAFKADKKGKGDIRIGFVYSFGNAQASLRDGVRLACMEINRKGILNGRKIELIEKDNSGSAEGCKKVIQELVDDRGVVVIIGGVNYMNFLSAAPLCEFNGIVFISPTLTSGIVSEMEFFRMAFINFPSIRQVIKTMYRALDENNLKRSYIISPSEFCAGYYFANAFDSFMPRNPTGETGIIYRQILYPQSPPELIEDSLELFESFGKFDSLLICGSIELVKETVGYVAKLKNKPVCFLSGEMENPEIAGFPECKKLRVFLPSTYDPGVNKKALLDFQKSYEKEFQKAPDVWAAQGYDTLNVLAFAIAEAKSSRPSSIVDALLKVKYENNVTVAPFISFNNYGELSSGRVIMKSLENGVFKVVPGSGKKEK
ncbi:MAG: hypothetical protein A2017_03530 [Lentisphaerae bacterium GWF2_44_16]|nr:MAG: hypothetical protein A2017_03530 [Lentisphaerae bacterium GWF2_44_16]